MTPNTSEQKRSKRHVVFRAAPRGSTRFLCTTSATLKRAFFQSFDTPQRYLPFLLALFCDDLCQKLANILANFLAGYGHLSQISDRSRPATINYVR